VSADLPRMSTLLAEILSAAETLPPAPAELRIGPHVLPFLKASAAPAGPTFGSAPPLGVRIVEDAKLPPGQWHITDQRGEELRSGNLWPLELPVTESDLLPAGTHAIVYTPPDDDEFGPGACVIVRAGGGR
jgi:hypothetical protein